MNIYSQKFEEQKEELFKIDKIFYSDNDFPISNSYFGFDIEIPSNSIGLINSITSDILSERDYYPQESICSMQYIDVNHEQSDEK